MDLGPLDPCPYSKSGRHHIGIVTPGEDSGDLTLFCDACATVRRIPASGSLPLDSATAETIRRMVNKE